MPSSACKQQDRAPTHVVASCATARRSGLCLFFVVVFFFFFLRIRRPPRSTPFPYPTLFRSGPWCWRTASPSRRPAMSRSAPSGDRKSTRLNSSHGSISYAVFCLQQKQSTPHLQLVCHTALLRQLPCDTLTT